ncbi:GLPGLI family protein [Pedobacter petrophilus]|uniref:GLPGLI family protein n=1 Tax=Pedobacter petrophilus TaxID=1908241 RepID=A0A7K0FSN3_9SPHI|nr:GLPGLI family protein [Pedobacter petrophilus]MRX74618.1 GLPGLI family protein [Pedobacter petrophilus]
MKNYFFILAAMICFNANAQSVIIRYEERANIENQLKNVTDPETRKRVSAHLSKPTNYLLYYDNGVSFYIAEPESDKNEELSLKDNDQAKKVEIGKNSGGLYKNQKTNEYLHEADILGKKFLVIDQLVKYNWTITTEGKSIGTYKVKKATAKINGENITAWYTTDLPIQDGPKDYYGLPGLIIEVIGEKKTYQAVKVINNKSGLTINKPSKGEKVNKEKYNKILNEKINELKQGIGNSLGN